MSPSPDGTSGPVEVLQFDQFVLDLSLQRLSRGGEAIKLRPRTWDVLCHLVARPGALVTKNELIDAVWDEVSVSEVTLSTSISELRTALGDSARSPHIIETVHGRGFRFIGRLGAADGVDESGKTAHFVGRESEKEEIASWIRSAASGARVVGFVHGEAGIGKSEVVRSVIEGGALRGEFLLGVGHCVDRLCEGESFGPILQALGSLAEGLGRDRVAPALSSRAPSWLVQVPSLVSNLSADRRAQLEREARGVNPARAVRELAEALEDLATHTSVVLWLEDIHWADSGTWDVLEALSRRATPARLSIIATHRPPTSEPRGLELRSRKPELIVSSSGRDLALPPMSRANLGAYLEARCPGLPEKILDPLHTHTGGNALFVACVVEQLIASGQLSAVGGAWSLGDFDPAADLGVPAELQLLMHRQFDVLSDRQKMLLEAASVSGTDFCSRSVAAAIGSPIDEIEVGLDELVDHHGILRRRVPQTWPEGGPCGGYSFSHALRAQAAYDRVPASRRARHHLAIAEDLLLGYGKQSSAVAAELAGHYLAAGLPDKVLFYLCRAAETAIATGGWDQAEMQLAQAAQVLAGQPAGADADTLEVDLQLTKASLCFVRRGIGDVAAREAYERLGVLGERLGFHDLQVKSLDGIAGYHIGRAEFDDVLVYSNRMLELAETHGEPLYQMLALAKSACARFYQGDFIGCARDAAEGLPLYQASGAGRTKHQIDTDPTTVASTHAVVALQSLGRTEEASALSLESLAHARSLTDPFNECFALMYASYYRWFTGDWKSGLDLAEECVTMAALHGYAMQWRIARIFLELGHAELGLPTLPEANPPEESGEESEGSQMGAPGLLWCVAREHLLRGRAEDALGSAALAMALAKETKAPFQTAEILAVQAGAALALGQSREAADALYGEAFDLSRAQQTSWVELRLLIDCAERLGLDEVRRERLAELVARFSGFASPLQARAAQLSAA